MSSLCQTDQELNEYDDPFGVDDVSSTNAFRESVQIDQRRDVNSREPVGERISHLEQLEIFRRLKCNRGKIDGGVVNPQVQYAVLRAIADRQPKCFISLETLAQESGGWGESTVRRAVRALEKQGLLRVEEFMGRTYRIVVWERVREVIACTK